jgi:hypothetical protein
MKASMFPIILITGLVLLPVIIGAICAVVGFRTYRTRRQFRHDVERAQNRNGMPPTNENTTTYRSWNCSWSLSRNQPDIVTPNIAPAFKPLSPPKSDIKGVGGGFVEHWGPGSSKSPSMPDNDTHYEHARRYVSNKEQETNNFENANLYAGPSWIPDNECEVSVEPDIPAPQPMYTSALYGRYGSAVSPTTRMYGEDARAADNWAKIERREALVEKRVPQAAKLPDEEEFEDVDPNGGGDSKDWREAKRPSTHVFVVGMGSTEEEHIDEEEAQGHTGCTPAHTPKTRCSFSSERSSSHRRSFPPPKQSAKKSSWSTASSNHSRRSWGSTRKNVDETPHLAQSLRRTFSTTSKEVSEANSSVGRASDNIPRPVLDNVNETPSYTPPMRRSYSTTSKKASLVNPFANCVSSELRWPELVGYSDSDDEVNS